MIHLRVVTLIACYFSSFISLLLSSHHLEQSVRGAKLGCTSTYSQGYAAQSACIRTVSTGFLGRIAPVLIPHLSQ